MRGITEEDQMAMAIAASLQDVNTATNENTAANDTNEGSEEDETKTEPDSSGDAAQISQVQLEPSGRAAVLGIIVDNDKANQGADTKVANSRR
mmetsp:Transcript_31095/g.45939  ORF Transcript_31095/g.45939 Transcript_31095/m.45939 type:complete len:93 (+) Transcript_31095:450-728(+)